MSGAKAEIKVVILDKDGVFVDFKKLWGRIISYRAQVIAENALSSWDGFEGLRADSMRVMGVDPETEKFDPHSPGSCLPFDYVKIALAASLFTNMTKLNKAYAWKDALETVEKSVTEVKKNFDYVELSEPIEGSVEKIDEIEEAGFKLAVLTSDMAVNAEGALKKFEIEDRFVKVFGGKTKTEELYKEVCKSLGVNPANTVMVGDTPLELKSAKACGAMTIGLLSGVIDEENREILEEHADHVLNSLADLDLALLGEAKQKNSSEPQDATLTIFTDGASRGNPGDASVGVSLQIAGEEIDSISETLGIATNNEAEYKAMIAGLERAIESGYKKVIANSDSQLLVKQLKGEYKVKSPNVIPLVRRIKALESNFNSLEYIHVRREFNKRADELANMALDQLI